MTKPPDKKTFETQMSELAQQIENKQKELVRNANNIPADLLANEVRRLYLFWFFRGRCRRAGTTARARSCDNCAGIGRSRARNDAPSTRRSDSSTMTFPRRCVLTDVFCLPCSPSTPSICNNITWKVVNFGSLVVRSRRLFIAPVDVRLVTVYVVC